MATSPIYSWPEPDNTDLVKNGALAIRTLGDAIDTTMGTMVAKTIVDAKGDLIAATAADTVARLAVGTNGQTLVADSSTATGLKWANASSGLTLINQSSFTAVADTGTTFDGVFSSSYFDYLIVVDFIFSSVNDTEVQIQARYAGPTTQTTDYYGITRRLNFAGTVQDFAVSAGSSFTLGKTTDGKTGCLAGQYHVSQVGNASEQFKMQGVATDGASIGPDLFGGKIQNSRTYTGFLLKMSSGNITGRVSVYGLAK